MLSLNISASHSVTFLAAPLQKKSALTVFDSVFDSPGEINFCVMGKIRRFSKCHL